MRCRYLESAQCQAKAAVWYHSIPVCDEHAAVLKKLIESKGGRAEFVTIPAKKPRKAIQKAIVPDYRTTPYRQLLDFQTLCEHCGEEMILIATDNPCLPTFHFCGCRRPTFELVQDGVGPIPSFARAVFQKADTPNQQGQDAK